ncbi:hypothetical protein ACFCV9_02995 [Streptomyces sp. NPDC056367]|uniref:hypothetical protein n=1 Tax=Streptomyces sp. NPDC056367 TaxID=3345797 RepID=UPI0035DAFFDA
MTPEAPAAEPEGGCRCTPAGDAEGEPGNPREAATSTTCVHWHTEQHDGKIRCGDCKRQLYL